jgi:hypothetical protein
MYRVTLDFADGTSQMFDDVENYNVEEVQPEEEEVEDPQEEETEEEE